ncbi:thiamine pyrophosphate-binding protein [Fructilactobacillus myrtifloralis]|uniref:Alpha-keto-acid decarboxylase n=1 Tax=Fructilactobacillus myrtifloralis TaxID=2940301 RepID=A0ABY5BP31_9LACO|nr:thiamine pyrophosphate-binding protein [Fructilactobacillus myrtifloralis]USS85454.1 thiamine pyrophosphate-binding protein [Fructilactobacillus myrtifloralis]
MSSYTISDYLLDVLQYGQVHKVLGVPGDYNLNFLDHVLTRKDMEWCGNVNELNAAYLADGYARQQGLAAFVTTYGVGELSAINGFAGSQTEGVPVLEIVGLPTTDTQRQQKRVHHSLGDGQFGHFQAVHQELGIVTEVISARHAVTAVNRVIRKLVTTKQPAYLGLPCDLTELPVNPAFKQLIPTLFTAPDAIPVPTVPFQLVQQAIHAAQHPFVVIGQAISQFHLGPVLQAWLAEQNLPFVDLIDSKGAVTESMPQFMGTYHGKLANEALQAQVEQADVVFLLGSSLSDANTAGFSHQFDPDHTITMNPAVISLYGETLVENPQEQFPTWIQQLCQCQRVTSTKSPESTTPVQPAEPVAKPHQPVSQAFYQAALAHFVQPNDVVIAEQGTSQFTVEDLRLPAGAEVISQPLWASIGYAFPAALGSQLANPDRRHLLSIGDGSFLLTIQELAFAIEHQLTPIILLLDNQGYTIERVIHGEQARYNDVPQLNYQHLLTAFGAAPDTYRFAEITTETELITQFRELQQATPKLTLLQIRLQKLDAPQTLRKFVNLLYDDE